MSQHLADLYLNRLDHFVKETLRIRGYMRYMDDFLCFDDGKERLHEAHAEVAALLRDELRLSLKERKCFLAPVTQGVPFLGYRIYRGTVRGTVRLGRQGLVRLLRKLRRGARDFVGGPLDERAFIASAGSLVAHAAHGNTVALRRNCFAEK